MGLYGMTSGQALGQGTFTFDRIVPNRYLLDSRVNNDGVMPGRYALIEYDRPIAVIKKVELILNTTDNTYELPNDFSFKYNVNSKETYNQFPVNNEKSYDIIPVDENGKISMVATAISKIFICIQTPGQETTYNYFYANIPEQSSALLTKVNFTLYEPNKPGQDGEEYKYNPLTPNEFNKIVDKAYIAKNTADDIDSKASDLWDSTAWIKIIDKEKSEFKYIKIADLNVLTPSFTVGTNKSPLDDNNNFVAPTITPTEGEPGSFTIQFPAPLDIDLIVNDGSQPEEGEEEFQRVTAEYIKNKTKQFTIEIPEIQNAIAATTAANNATTAATTAADKANAAADAADEAREGLNGSIVNSIGTENLTVSIGGETSLSGGKLNIETTINSDRIITAAIINNLWNPQEIQEGN